MSKTVEFHSSIKGGLPVLVLARVHPAEPDVGCGESAEIEGIFWLSERAVTDTVWNSIPRADFDRLEEEAVWRA
jgi:hypothetical protein